jgi:mxaJ protein
MSRVVCFIGFVTHSTPAFGWAEEVKAPAPSTDSSTPQPQKRVLRIAADPANLPFSNQRQDGFENELASIIAQELNANIEYLWRPQRRGFFRETLGQNKCDLVLGVPTQSTECLTTTPWYRSSYVWLSRRDDRRFREPLRHLERPETRIGIQLLGDGAVSPAAHSLIERGWSDRLVTYSLFAERPEATPALVRAVRDREIDTALSWGPAVGYFVKQADADLAVTPLNPEDFPGYPVQFEISLGVRRSDVQLRDELNAILSRKQREISALLDRVGVPVVEMRPTERTSP